MVTSETYEDRYIIANDIRLHVVFAGPEDGEPVLLLHGFPEFWYGWRHQIPFLVGQGYRVIVPDQRGYNLSEKPAAVRDYRLSTLVHDVIGLMEALGYEQVNLAGHDWGAAVAWATAAMYPQRLKKLAILNVPHPGVMQHAMRSGNLNQLLKSWYIFAFQIPLLPETLMGINGYQGFAEAIQRSGKAGTFSEKDLVTYRSAWSQPGAVTAMLNWYRAAARYGGGTSLGKREKITVPTLMIWGEQDVALEKDLASASIELCENGRLVFLPEATHWVQHDEAEQVNRLLDTFLRGAPPEDADEQPSAPTGETD